MERLATVRYGRVTAALRAAAAALLLCALLQPRIAAAAPAAVADGGGDTAWAGFGADSAVLEDAGGRMVLADVIQPGAAWKRSEHRSFNFGMSRSAFWIRISMRNPGDRPRNLVLDLGTAMQDYVDWYLVDAQGRVELENHTGDRLPFDSRLIPVATLALPFALPAQQARQLLIRVDTHDGLHELLAPQLYTPEAFRDRGDRIDFVLAMYFGGMAALALLNSLLWLRTRELAFGYYVGYLTAMLICLSCVFAFDLKYLWPNDPVLHHVAELVSEFTIFITATLFTFRYIGMSRHISRGLLRTYYGALAVVSLGMIPALRDNYLAGLQWMLAGTILMIGFYAHFCVLALRGVREARLIAAAFSVFVVGLTVYALSLTGVMPSYTWTTFVLPVGSSIEMLLLSFGLAGSMSWLEAQRRQAEELIVSAQQQRIRDAEAGAAREQHLRLHDPVTGLPNQIDADEHLAQALATRPVFTMMLIAFRGLRDLGIAQAHEIHDEALLKLAALLRQRVQAGDYLARLAGDVFMLLMPDKAIGRAAAIADRLIADTAAPVRLLDVDVELVPYFGIVAYPVHGGAEAELLGRGRIALQEAQALPGQLQIYQQGSDVLHDRTATLIRDVRHAARQDQLVLHYQPVIDPQTGRCTGAEALMRWQHPQLGLLMPGEFIPLAEHSYAMPALTRWAIDAALGGLCSAAAGNTPMAVSVNVTVQDLRLGDLASYVASRLAAHGVPPELLTLEVTETGVMLDPQMEIAMLGELRSLGIGIAVDDFGTGYSSLLYLKRLPVTTVKIDRSFVTDLREGTRDAVIVKSIIDMAHTLGLHVVAEGIETPASLALLREWGCDGVQGMLISKGLPEGSLREWLAARVEGNV